jgi:hypothetical protein
MKQLIKILLFTCLSVSAFGQAKPNYERSRTAQSLSDWATWSKYFMLPPTGATPSMPAYIPDSLRDGALWNVPGVSGKLKRYNKVLATWEDVSPDVSGFKQKSDSTGADGYLRRGSLFPLSDPRYGRLASPNIWAGPNTYNNTSTFNGTINLEQTAYVQGKTMTYAASTGIDNGAGILFTNVNYLGLPPNPNNLKAIGLPYFVSQIRSKYLDTTFLKTNGSNAAKKVNIPTRVSIGDTTHKIRYIYSIGTSLTVGVGFGGVTSVDSIWGTKLAKKLGAVFINKGLSGRKLQQLVSTDSSAYATRASIPYYTPGSFLFGEFMINDPEADSTIHTPAIWTTQVNGWLDEAVAKGWPLSTNVCIANMAWYDPTTVSSYPHTQSRHDQYYAAMQAIGTSRGVLTYDGFYPFYTAWLSNPGILEVAKQHPTNSGHTVITNALYAFLSSHIPTYTLDTLLRVYDNARFEYDLSVGHDIKAAGTVRGRAAEFGGLLSSGIAAVGTLNSQAYSFLNNLTLNTLRNIGIGSIGQIEAGTTGTVRYNSSLINLADGATPNAVYAYEARKGGFGTGTIATMVGYKIASTFVNPTGDTYGIDLDLAASANVFNFRANGTAQSYHMGLFGFGLGLPTARIDVAGSSTTAASQRFRSAAAPTSQLAGNMYYTSPDLLFVNSGTTPNFFMFGTAKPTSAQFPVSNGTNYTPVTMSNDATMSNTGAVTLKNTGTPGTYRSVTVDAQGRVTAGTNPTTLAAYGITDAASKTEGLWTPVPPVGGTFSGASVGRYTKTGNIVHAYFTIVISGYTNPASGFEFTGLPFANSANSYGMGIIGYQTIQANAPTCIVDPSTSAVKFYNQSTQLTEANIGTATIRGEIIYSTTN